MDSILNKKALILFLNVVFKKIVATKPPSRFAIDVILITISALLIFFMAIKNEAFEYLIELTHTYEQWELGEFFSFLLIFSIALLVIVIRNIKYLKLEIKHRMDVEAEIKKLAFYDTLTGLPNRALCNSLLENILTHAERSNEIIAVLFIDLDNFKKINDTYGHDAGDELLKLTTQRLLNGLRKSDTLARFAGDEFIIILNSLVDASNAKSITEKLLKSMDKIFILNGYETHVSISIGISIYPTDALDAKTIIKHADIAMYQVKHGGKNSFKFFSAS